MKVSELFAPVKLTEEQEARVDAFIDEFVELILEDDGGDAGGDASGPSGDGSGAAPGATPMGSAGPTSAPTAPAGGGGPGGAGTTGPSGPPPVGPHPCGPSGNGGFGGGNHFANAWFNTFATSLLWLTSATRIKKRMKEIGLKGEGVKRMSDAVEMARGHVNNLLSDPGWRQQNWTMASGVGQKKSQAVAKTVHKLLGSAIKSNVKKHKKKVHESLVEGFAERLSSQFFGTAPKTPKYKVGDVVEYEMSPSQKDGKGKGRITKMIGHDHYVVNGKPVNHFEIKKKVSE